MKRTLYPILFFLLLGCLLLLCSCKEVCFLDSEDNTLIATKKIPFFSHNVEIKQPTKQGHTFSHWSLSPNGQAFNSDSVNKTPKKLYAVWMKNKYNVTFYDGDSVFKSTEVAYGGKIAEPKNPTKEDYTFQYWSEKGKTKFDFSSSITKNTNLHAVWKIVPGSKTHTTRVCRIIGITSCLILFGLLFVIVNIKKRKRQTYYICEARNVEIQEQIKNKIEEKSLPSFIQTLEKIEEKKEIQSKKSEIENSFYTSTDFLYIGMKRLVNFQKTDKYQILLTNPHTGDTRKFSFSLSSVDFSLYGRAEIIKALKTAVQYGYKVDEKTLNNWINKCIERLKTYSSFSIDLGKIVRNSVVKECTHETKTNQCNENPSNKEKRGNTNMKQKKTISNNSTDKAEKNPISPLMKELDSMIGLKSVKEEVHTMIDQVKINKMKIDAGLKVANSSMHLVFTGNPGTGKTTVARLIGKIYFQMGITKKEVFIEADRSSFIAEYMGQTAIKTAELVRTARGGILFIDEAYALNQGMNDEYGREAVDTLLKLMEDYRKNLIVIIAGYTSEISKFLHSNPGLESRFPTTIHFEDYNADELKQIFLLICKKDCYTLMPKALEKLASVTDYLYETRSDNFANAREIRNLYEKVLKNQASRLAQKDTNPSRKELLTIMEEDFKGL